MQSYRRWPLWLAPFTEDKCFKVHLCCTVLCVRIYFTFCGQIMPRQLHHHTHSFTYLLVDTGCSHLSATLNSAAGKTGAHISVQTRFCFSGVDTVPKGEALCQMTTTLTSRGIVIVFKSSCFISHPQVLWSSQFLHVLSNICDCLFISTCVSLMTFLASIFIFYKYVCGA